ncbi:MAG: beta-propeller fold lactonase family protein [Vicinamibacterales bacterium]
MRRFFVTLLLVIPWSTLTGHAGKTSTAETDGVVYIASNGAGGNEILVFDRNERGSLSFAHAAATGGLGTGGGLGNQGGLVLSADGRWLVVVNAGSHDVSVFRVDGRGLTLTSRTSSGGQRPVSVTIDRDLVYVLNAGGVVGGADNIAGFRLGRRGRLLAIPGAVQALSGSNTAPAQIGFTPDGEFLVVTERATNLIAVFSLIDDEYDGHDGVARPGEFYPSAGLTPFGFAFDRRGRLYVTEAAGGATDASSVSSYQVTQDGVLEVISAAVATTETAACSLVITADGRSALTTNTGSDTVSALRIDPDGTLVLRDQDGVAAPTDAGSAPADAALSAGSQFLYTRNGGNGTISTFSVNGDGALTSLSTFGGLPGGANGIAAR